MARPRASDWLSDEIAGWRDDGVALVICLLEDSEIAELGLAAEGRLCGEAGMDFMRFPIGDRQVPADAKATLELCRQVNQRRAAGNGVAIHCRAGIGRSSLMAATSLALLGIGADAAFDQIAAARGLRVPDTDEQRRWVEDLVAQ